MTTQATQLEIVKKVLSTENPKLLSQILSLFKSEKEDFWKLLSKEEKNEILEGISQLNKGKRHSYDSVMKKYRK
jgi:Mg/Co/Ni transporter MgtE